MDQPDATGTSEKTGTKAVRHGCTTGFRSIDQAIQSLVCGSVHLIAARTGGGATSLACGIALANARAGVPVLYLCGRSHRELHIWCRLYSVANDVPTSALLNWTCSPEQKRTLCRSSHLIGNLPLQTDQLDGDEQLSGALTAIAWHTPAGTAGLVIIDTLQDLACCSLFGIPERIGPHGALRRLVWLAEVTCTTVIATSRLCCRANRAAGPQFSAIDLAGSSRLSCLARTTLTLHRSNLADGARPDPDDSAIGINVVCWRGRQRCGPPVRLLFETDNGRFHDLGPMEGLPQEEP